MSDFKILRRDGYVALPGVMDAVRAGTLNIRRLWHAVGRGDTAEAALQLFAAGFYEEGDDDALQVDEVRDVVVISVPDDLLEDLYLVWVKATRRLSRRLKQDWSPRDEDPD